MTLWLYYNPSETHAVTKNLALGRNFTGTLKTPVDISNPVITLEIDTPLSYNYAYIPEFNRYYFIVSCSVLRTNLWELTLHVDVLMSFKNDFLKLGAVIARQENEYNLFLKDGLMQTKVPRVITVKNFPNTPKPATEGKGFILSLAGGPIITIESEEK